MATALRKTKIVCTMGPNLFEKDLVKPLMLVGMEGTEPSAAFQKELQENHYGGVILFDRNMKDPDQVKALNSRLQALARPEPLLIGGG